MRVKLDFCKLEKVCGGKIYFSIIGFDKNKPAAIVFFPEGYMLAFNPGDPKQISLIKERKTFFRHCVDLDENSTSKFSYQEICNWYSNQ